MDYDNIPLVVSPFAAYDSQKDYSFYKDGITRQMTVPAENGGARFTRHQMNGIGYLATLGAFLDRVGYPYGRERLDPSSFGGYPKGAILMTQEDGCVREYVSLIDNNTHALPVETNGEYKGNEWWAPTIPTDSASFFPSFADPTVFSSFTMGPISFDKDAYKTVDISETGWYSVQRTFQYTSRTEVKGAARLSSIKCSIRLHGDGLSNGAWVLTEPLNGILGETASTLIPVAQGNSIGFYIYDGYYSTTPDEFYCYVTIRKLQPVELQ